MGDNAVNVKPKHDYRPDAGLTTVVTLSVHSLPIEAAGRATPEYGGRASPRRGRRGDA